MNKFCLVTAFLCSMWTANAVELMADERKVQIFATGGNSESTPDFPFAAFSTNGQNTNVSANQFSGTGSGYGESDFDFFVRESIFDITFSAISDTPLDLSGTFVSNSGNFGLATIRVQLFAGADIDNQNLVYSDSLAADTFKEVTADFSFNDVLAAGTYRLVLRTDITPGGFDTYGDFSFTAQFTSDADNDGLLDDSDNCLFIANTDQTDSDGDDFGNACDADLNNDCIVNAADLGLLRLVFFTADAAADFNSDGVVNVTDLGIMRSLFFMRPGPSGTTLDCAISR